MTNDSFQWRPNDNSALTNLRYDLEASKWVKAVDSAQNRLPKGSIASDLGFIGNLIMLPLLLIFFILMIPIMVIKEVFKYNIKVFPGDEPTGPILNQREKFNARMEYLHKKYPSPAKKKKKTTKWEDLTAEEQDLVRFTRAATAEAKANWR